MHLSKIVAVAALLFAGANQAGFAAASDGTDRGGHTRLLLEGGTEIELQLQPGSHLDLDASFDSASRTDSATPIHLLVDQGGNLQISSAGNIRIAAATLSSGSLHVSSERGITLSGSIEVGRGDILIKTTGTPEVLELLPGADIGIAGAPGGRIGVGRNDAISLGVAGNLQLAAGGEISILQPSGTGSISALPEPESWAMLLAGLALLGRHRRSDTGRRGT